MLQQISITLLLLIIAGNPSAASNLHRQTGSIAESHIRANVPDEQDFDRFLKRDLEVYFRKYAEKPVVVEYELLRKAPTQAGVALPKFYVWVKIYEKDKLLEEGAVRVAAFEKKGFDVVQYLTKDEIKMDREKMYKIFPKAVGDKIIEKIDSQK